MKKAAKPVHAANGIRGKKEMLPLMDKDVAGAISELRCAPTFLKAPDLEKVIPTIIAQV